MVCQYHQERNSVPECRIGNHTVRLLGSTPHNGQLSDKKHKYVKKASVGEYFVHNVAKHFLLSLAVESVYDTYIFFTV